MQAFDQLPQPLAEPIKVETCPAAMLASTEMMKKGETRFGPSLRNFECSRSMPQKSPMPLLM
jgi:hypothetical protein